MDAPSPNAPSRADLALADALGMCAPVARWLLRNGVNYVGLAQALKSVFLAEARKELERTGAKVTDSALSVLSGVHRKDVRTWTGEAVDLEAQTPTPASKLFTRWLTHPTYREQAGGEVRPMARLPRSGSGLSFESLAREISSDVHPRTLLEELVRLGLVVVEGDSVVLAATSFTRSAQDQQAMALGAANVADHLNAAVHNLTLGAQQRFLEQSVFAGGLSEESVQALAELARELWQPAFQAMVAAATRHYEQDRVRGGARHRMRYGVYFYRERQGEAPAGRTRRPRAGAPAAASADPAAADPGAEEHKP